MLFSNFSEAKVTTSDSNLESNAVTGALTRNAWELAKEALQKISNDDCSEGGNSEMTKNNNDFTPIKNAYYTQHSGSVSNDGGYGYQPPPYNGGCYTYPPAQRAEFRHPPPHSYQQNYR